MRWNWTFNRIVKNYTKFLAVLNMVSSRCSNACIALCFPKCWNFESYPKFLEFPSLKKRYAKPCNHLNNYRDLAVLISKKAPIWKNGIGTLIIPVAHQYQELVRGRSFLLKKRYAKHWNNSRVLGYAKIWKYLENSVLKLRAGQVFSDSVIKPISFFILQL